MELPEYIENQVIENFQALKDKEEDIDLDAMPFKSIRMELGELYNVKDKMITYEQCEKAELRKIERKKNKKRRKVK